MAAQVSFDVTSTVDLQEVDNAVNQATQGTRRSGTTSRDRRRRSSSSAPRTRIELVADDNFKMDALWDILQTRLIRRGVPGQEPEAVRDRSRSVGGLVKRTVDAAAGHSDARPRKSIVKFLKDQKLKKVQANIQGDQLRVSSPSKDELQADNAPAEGTGLRRRAAVRQLPRVDDVHPRTHYETVTPPTCLAVSRAGSRLRWSPCSTMSAAFDRAAATERGFERAQPLGAFGLRQIELLDHRHLLAAPAAALVTHDGSCLRPAPGLWRC